MKLYMDTMLQKIAESNKDYLESLGYQLTLDETEAQVVVSSDKDIIDNAKQAKFIQLQSAGFDFLDVEAIKAKGVLIANARDVYSDGIAEFVIGRILSVLQKHEVLRQKQQNNEWDRQYHFQSLENMNVAIVGSGSIGQQIAGRLKPFGPKLIGYNRSGQQAMNFDVCYTLDTFDLTLPKMDIVILAVPLTKDSKHLINKERIQLMKEDVILVNIARGSVINEPELIESLDNHFQAVILDVFEKEPLDTESPLWSHPKVYLSSHVSFRDNRYKEELKHLILNNLQRYAEQKYLINPL